MQCLRIAATWLACCVLYSAAVNAAEKLTFEEDVRPILKAHCFQCHGEAGVKEGALDVRLRHWLLAGGESGAAIEPGQPDESLMLQRVSSGEMPPGDKSLSPEELSALRQWIEQGAETARGEPETLEDGDYLTEEERSFWSFQPVTRPPAPDAGETLIENPIDAFVLQRLQQKSLSFSEPADRAQLIRRATFDLWGLPPDPQIVTAFVNDRDPLAYERLIDRLLSSPRYGERWGRHWLDVAGYADSDGYTDQDTEREFAYFYRDYVIDSFNDDKPLDQFVCEQLAGDEIESGSDDGPVANANELTPGRIAQLAATGFLRMAADGTASPSVDRAVAANDTIADTIDIVSTSLLGLTVGCARCHDHRYDPISQADYYRFRAIFEPALDWRQWKVPSQRQLSLSTAQENQQRAAVELQAKEAETARTRRQEQHIQRTLDEELLVVPDDRREPLETAYKTEKAKRTAEQVALLEEYPSVGNITAGSLYLYAEQRARRADGIEKAASQREARYIEQTQMQQLSKIPAEHRDEVQKLITVVEPSQTDKHKSLATTYPDVLVDAKSLQRLNPDAYAEVQRYRDAAKVCREQDAKTELASMQAAIVAIRNTAPKERFLRVLTEPADHTPPTHLFIRGDHHQLGQQLHPDELTVVQSSIEVEISDDDPHRITSGRRLAYARHLTSGKHPLLSRVLANRIWLHHFGRGIVDSPGDFGRLGARPTHPELLDWLADELVRGQWTLKRMHRLMMLSRTYQQDSARTEVAEQVDPDNRLYARMAVRRLESEAIRDAMLEASGSMIHQLHGPPVPVKEDAVGQIVLGREMLDGERKPSGADTDFEGASRRSIYIQVRRSRPLAVLDTFDVASLVPNCTHRHSSNVATQSLLMMNSQFSIDHADKLAGRILAAGDGLSEQLRMAWKLCFSREIEDEVLAQLIAFVEQQETSFQTKDAKLTPAAAHRLSLASVCQALFSSNEFLYVD